MLVPPPLTDLLENEVEWTWSTTQEQSFQKLKVALCQASTLAYSDVSRTFVVHLDTSNVAMSVTLPQKDASGQQCLLNCASRKFDSAERNYPTNERSPAGWPRSVSVKLRAKGINPQESKLKAVREWPTPTSAKDIRIFLGICGLTNDLFKIPACWCPPHGPFGK